MYSSKLSQRFVQTPYRRLACGASVLALAAAPALGDVTGFSGNVVVVAPPVSVDMGAYESDTQIRVFYEQQSVVLGAALQVDAVGAGQLGPGAPSAPGPFVIPAGTRVSSYFMHADAASASAMLQGGVDFDLPVLGVIFSDALLDASDGVLGSAATLYPTGAALRGMDVVGTPADAGDGLLLQGKGVSALMPVTSVQDQVRVLIGHTVAWSVDIGSAREFSDPTTDGDEVLDPGDMYLVGITPEAGIFWNDIDYLGITFPDAPAAAPYGPCTPPGSANIYFQNNDLDGFDEIGLNLSTYQGDFPIHEDQLDDDQRLGITDADNLLISFDDDGAPGWPLCNPMGRMPVESPSPAGATYGSMAGQDEILRLDLTAAPFPFVIAALTGWADEVSVHVDLSPDPGAGSQAEDDDVDALDVLAAGSAGYVSVDHEGRGDLGGPLNPGAIYLSSAGGLVQVLSPASIGLPAGTDVDAFEFVWLRQNPADPNAPRFLAIVFSTDQDDVRTAAIDESGMTADPTLDARTLYFSFMDGARGVLVDGQELGDDVDAIAAIVGNGQTAPCDDPIGNRYCMSFPNSSGNAAMISATGSSSVADHCLELRAEGLPANVFGIIYYGSTMTNQPFGDGIRCVAGSLQRLPAQQADAAGVMVEPNVFDQPTPNFPLAPGTIFVQSWFRDSASAAGFNLTDGVEITLVP